MSDVVLIYPYFRTHARNEMLFHPLGIAQLAALLRSKGVDTVVVDCTFRQRDEVLAEVEEARPRIVGTYVMVSMSDNARRLAREFRERLPETVLVCGGPLPTVAPEQFTRDFDLVFRGEAVDSFPRFCVDFMKTSGSKKDLSGFRKNASAYPGLYGRCAETKAHFQSRPQSSSEIALNRLPIPDRSDYNHGGYQQFWSQKDTYSRASIMSSFGCPYSCDFCSKPIFGRTLRVRRTDNVIKEIRDIKRWGYEGLWVADDCLTLALDHMRDLCRRLIKEKLNVKWTCLSRVDGITAQDVKLMRDAGCEGVYLGLESGNNEILKLMNKGTTVEAAEQAVELFSHSGIRTAGFFIVGYPGETPETVENTFAWALSLPLDEISFTVPYPLPGTGLFDKVREVSPCEDWICENENRILYESEFDEEYLKKRIEETYAQFESSRRAGAL